MMQSARVILALITVVLLAPIAACRGGGDMTSPGTSGSDLAGSWSRIGNVPGSSFELGLALSDTVITGTGTFAVEAGHAGTLMVSGFRSGTTVRLVIVTDAGVTEHFNGLLSAPDTLTGWFWVETQLAPDSVSMSLLRTAH